MSSGQTETKAKKERTRAMNTPYRVYFIEVATGNEVLSGMWYGNGGRVNGEQGTMEWVEFKALSDPLGIAATKGKGIIDLRAKDFPFPVRVKLWAPKDIETGLAQNGGERFGRVARLA